jgi:hypothetical protein
VGRRSGRVGFGCAAGADRRPVRGGVVPHVDGESYTYGKFRTADHRCGVLDLVVALHSVPRPERPTSG